MQVLQTLPVRQAEVLSRYWGLQGPPETMRDLSKALGLTVARVNQLKHQALATLRADQDFMSLAHESAD